MRLLCVLAGAHGRSELFASCAARSEWPLLVQGRVRVTRLGFRDAHVIPWLFFALSGSSRKRREAGERMLRAGCPTMRVDHPTAISALGGCAVTRAGSSLQPRSLKGVLMTTPGKRRALLGRGVLGVSPGQNCRVACQDLPANMFVATGKGARPLSSPAHPVRAESCVAHPTRAKPARSNSAPTRLPEVVSRAIAKTQPPDASASRSQRWLVSPELPTAPSR